MHRTALLALALFLAGCPTEEEPEGWSCSTEEVAVDSLSGTVGGDDWDATLSGAIVTNATGLQLSYLVDATHTMTIILKRSATFVAAGDFDEGDDLVEDNTLIFDSSDLPMEVALGDGNQDGGDFTIQDSTANYNTEQGTGGYLKLTSLDGGVLRGCYYLNAALQDGSADVDSDGSFAATLP